MGNDLKRKCLQNEAKLDERQKEVIMLREESKCLKRKNECLRNESECLKEESMFNVQEREEMRQDIIRRENESNEVIRQKDAKIKEHVDSIKSLKTDIFSLQNEIVDM